MNALEHYCGEKSLNLVIIEVLWGWTYLTALLSTVEPSRVADDVYCSDNQTDEEYSTKDGQHD